MVEALLPMTTPDRSSLPTPMPPSVSLKTQQEIKSAVHQELIRRMDLEKLAAIQADEQGGRQRLLMHVIHAAHRGAEHSAERAGPRPAGAGQSWTRSSAWARWSRCCRIPPSTTSW